MLYTYKQEKIDYIRDHCKETAFEVIKTKANPTFPNAYHIISMMTQDLKNMFGNFDKLAKFDIFLRNPKFGMTISNLKKIFNKFIAYFTSAIMLSEFIDQHKILNL